MANKKFGEKHPRTAAEMIQLARIHFKLGDPNRSAQLIDRAIEIYQQTLPANDQRIEATHRLRVQVPEGLRLAGGA